MTQSKSSKAFRARCPHCRKTIQFRKSMHGRLVNCPGCGGQLQIASLPLSTSPQQESTSQRLAPENNPPIAPSSEEFREIHRNIWIAAWTGVGLFAVGSLFFCIWYTRAQHAAKVAAADLRVSQAITDAQELIAEDDDLAKLEFLEISLIEAMSDENVSDKQAGTTTLELVRQHAQSIQLWDDALQLIKRGNGLEAAIILKKYVARDHANNKAEAQWILKELSIANSDSAALDVLIAMDDERFLITEEFGTIEDHRVTRPELRDIFNETVKRNFPMARETRAARLEKQKQFTHFLFFFPQLLQQRALEIINAGERRRRIEEALKGLGSNPTELEKFLHAGEFTVALLEYQTQLLDDPLNDNLRFQLALVQFFSCIERLGQSLHRYGVKESINDVPFLRLPVPKNPTPDPITYSQFRRIFDDLIRDLDSVDSTLARIKVDELAVPLRLGLIRFDMDGDGIADQELKAILKQLHQQEFAFLQGNETIAVDFDRGDVTWLRIYCQLMAAVLDFALAFDLEPGFDQLALDVFDNPQVGKRNWGFGGVFRVAEPRRLGRFRHRLILITELNHEMWKQIRAEKDNGLEWLPNSNQQSVLGFTVSDPPVDSWLAAMTEVGAALKGERVIQGWQFQRNGKGLNLRLLLEDPPEAILQHNPTLCLVRKYFAAGVPFDLNTLEEVFRNYEKWLD